MLRTALLIGLIAAVASVTLDAPTCFADGDLSREQVQFFETKIRPVLIRECYGCHSRQTGNARGGLQLDTEQLLLNGGSSGPAIVPGNLNESLLYTAITYEDFEMPPKRKLPPSVIADFRKWIEMGAPDPRKTDVAEIKSSVSQEDIELARETFWAYRAVEQTTIPKTEGGWASSPIDHFIYDSLDAAELQPAADAQASVVLRRLCFDLIGLPPTPRQLSTFEKMWQADPQKAVEHVVDRLLETDQFGERWGRHWLDVARYAESTGREVNVTYPHAWRYRDFVIDSFNADKPFDHFIKQQLAGDLLPVEGNQEWTENLVATTFLAIGSKNVNEQNRLQFEADLVDEQIDATTRVFLATSVACARCHDHKFDPIPQQDYYALAGVFANMTTYWGNPPSEYGNFSPAQRKRNSSLLRLPIDDPNPYDQRYTRGELDELKGEIDDLLEEAVQSRRSAVSSGNAQALRARLVRLNRLSDLTAKLAVVDENGKPLSYCMGVQEKGSPRDVRMLERGEIDLPAQSVSRGFPQVLTNSALAIPEDSSGRLEIAQWIADPENPLTSRVMVNRIWQHMIGQAIVPTTENFGATGQTPSHPELLDYLANEFVHSGWSVKHVIRLIASSRTYRMQSVFNENYHEQDPNNRLHWRANPRRLEAEAIRDAMLMVSGELDLERPRGSEVAKAGYSTVREGVLGDAREKVQKQVAAISDQFRQSFRQQLAQRRSRLEGGQRRNGRPQFPSKAERQNMIAKATEKVTNELDMEEAKFRSVYLPIVRNEVPRSMEVFDFAAADTITGVRETSQTAGQALYMLNNEFVVGQSQAVAKRIRNSASTLPLQVNLAFQVILARQPTSAEQKMSTKFLRSYAQQSDTDLDSFEAFCQSLFSTAEFRIVD